MAKSRVLAIAFSAFLVAGFCAGSVSHLLAQAGPGAKQSAAKQSGSEKLTEQQARGAGLFFQRCAYCHLQKTLKTCCQPSIGPSLSGLFKNATPTQEKALREFILKGGPTYMPSFQYGLEPREIDDVIAYLKTQ